MLTPSCPLDIDGVGIYVAFLKVHAELNNRLSVAPFKARSKPVQSIAGHLEVFICHLIV